MKVLGISKKPRSYVLKDFRSETNPPIFILRTLSEFEKAEVEHAYPTDNLLQSEAKTALEIADSKDISDEEKVKKLSGVNFEKLFFASKNRQMVYLKKAISGWENVPVQEGDEIVMLPYSKENIDCLDEATTLELANEVLGIIPTVDAQNLDQPSSLQNGQEVKVDGIVETV